ncbi:MAG: putative toxin-antitoxin system toxin component, PIN family [Anaerolineae bacterium]
MVATNQLLRMAAAAERSPLFIAWQAHKFNLVISTELLAELEAVIARPNTQRFLPFGRGQRSVARVRQRALFVVPASNAPHCRDPKDDVVIATAVAAQAEFIITADRDLRDDDNLRQILTQNNICPTTSSIYYPGDVATIDVRYNQMYLAMRSQDFETAYNYMSPTYRQLYTSEEFKKKHFFCTDGWCALHSKHLVAISDKNRATLYPRQYNFFNFYTGPVYKLIKVDGEWYFNRKSEFIMD